MKKKLIISGLVLTLLLPNSPVYGEVINEKESINKEEIIDKIEERESKNELSVYIDGIPQEFTVAPFIENGTTLVPMRAIFEALGAEVKWIEHSKTVIATKQDVTVEIKIGSYFAKLNDEIVKLTVQPRLVEGTTMVPLRFVSEALGAEVEWDGDTRTIQISKVRSEQPSNDLDETDGQIKGNGLEDDSAFENEANHALTYEKAVEMALKNSYRLKIENDTIRRTEEVRDRLAESFIYSRPVGQGVGQEDLIARQSLLALAQTDIGLSQAKRMVSITEEAIAFQVKNVMDEILSTQIELAFIEEELEHTERKLVLAKIKEENGLESKFNVNMARTALEEGKKQRELLEKALDKAYLKLNQLIGKKDEERYKIVGGVTFEPVKVTDLDAHVHRVISQDPYVWLQEKNIEQAELGLTLYTYNAGQEPYAAKEIDVRNEKNKLMDLKSKLEESIRARFNDIQQLEKQYEVLEVNLKKAEDALNLIRTQYDAGMAIDIELEEAQLAVDRIKKEMEKLAFTHEKLKILFNKPYLAPDYLN